MTRIDTGRRFVFRDVPLTEEERVQMKKERIEAAMEWIPPTTRTVYDEVAPDDPRYLTAPMGEDWILIP